MNNMHYEIIYIVFFILLFLIATIQIILLNKKDTRTYIEKKKDIDLTLLLSDDVYNKCNDFLDSIIRSHINNYKVLTGFTPDSYITTNIKDEMVSYVTEMTKKNMSESIIYLIKTFYLVKTDEDLNKILDLRIKLNILADMVEQNAPIE